MKILSSTDSNDLYTDDDYLSQTDETLLEVSKSTSSKIASDNPSLEVLNSKDGHQKNKKRTQQPSDSNGETDETYDTAQQNLSKSHKSANMAISVPNTPNFDESIDNEEFEEERDRTNSGYDWTYDNPNVYVNPEEGWYSKGGI